MSGQETKIVEIKYNPQEYQRESHESPIRFKVIIRGRRGGKTEEEIQGAIKDCVTIPGLHWITGPTFRQIKSIVWTRLKAILRQCEDKAWIFNEAELYVEHPNIKDENGISTRIELKGVDKEDSLVGVGLRTLRCDEAALYKMHIWPQILRPMLVDHQAPAYFFSTPRGKNWLHDLYLRGLDPNEPNWKSWQAPSSVNKYLAEEEIAEMKKDMPHRLFLQEVMAEFLDDESGVFRKVNLCTVGELLPSVLGRFYVMGIDLGRTHDFTVLTVIDSITRGVVAHERFTDIEWKEQKLKIQELAKKYNHALCWIDSTGMGEPIFEDLRDSGLSVEPYTFSSNAKKVALIKQLEIAIEQRQITWPKELEILTQEVKDYEYQLTRMGNVTYGAPEGKYDDCVISLGLAVWGLRNQLREAQVISDSMEEEPIDRQGSGKLHEDVRHLETEFSGY